MLKLMRGSVYRSPTLLPIPILSPKPPSPSTMPTPPPPSSPISSLPRELRDEIYNYALEDGLYQFADQNLLYILRIGAAPDEEVEKRTDEDSDDGESYQHSETPVYKVLPGWLRASWEMYTEGLEVFCKRAVCDGFSERSWWIKENRGDGGASKKSARGRLPLRYIRTFNLLHRVNDINLTFNTDDKKKPTYDVDSDDDDGDNDGIDKEETSPPSPPPPPEILIPPNPHHTYGVINLLCARLLQTGTEVRDLRLFFSMPDSQLFQWTTLEDIQNSTINLSMLDVFNNPHLQSVTFAIHEPEIYTDDYFDCLTFCEIAYTLLQSSLERLAKQFVQHAHDPHPGWSLREWFWKEKFQAEARGWHFPTDTRHNWYLEVRYKRGVEEGKIRTRGLVHWEDGSSRETHFKNRRRGAGGVVDAVEWEADGYGRKRICLPEGWGEEE
ncbi:hypothetical protein P154DRAFT_320567 [Amniculicola lignicola CBS 123094]|uniref:F-box domain-containing protein n=1 Tax=Amniculicola lignicola CBS 123094 TaxID=1392246 RepID=A0A6A5W3T0_9PLEO|nr:hypothetical protein P154DRAFT_320567 [Amniculicola lignicola CBS 123094]